MLHYSPRTEEAYVYWIRRFIFHHGVRHPGEMGADEVRAFLSHLAVQQHVSASTQNQALCALTFLYRRILDRDLGSRRSNGRRESAHCRWCCVATR